MGRVLPTKGTERNAMSKEIIERLRKAYGPARDEAYIEDADVLKEAAAEIERLQAHNGLMKAAIEEFGEAFNQKPVASVKDDFERVNAALEDSWKERERLRGVLIERNTRIAALEAENAKLRNHLDDCEMSDREL
jgi:hypothetical protein